MEAIDWKKILIFALPWLGAFIISWVIGLAAKRKKLETEKKECPRCNSSDVFYIGQSGAKRKKKEGLFTLLNYYIFECRNCKARFKYFGKL